MVDGGWLMVDGGLWMVEGGGSAGKEFADEVGAAYAAQALLDAWALLGLVPEEILALGELLAGAPG